MELRIKKRRLTLAVVVAMALGLFSSVPVMAQYYGRN